MTLVEAVPDAVDRLEEYVLGDPRHLYDRAPGMSYGTPTAHPSAPGSTSPPRPSPRGRAPAPRRSRAAGGGSRTGDAPWPGSYRASTASTASTRTAHTLNSGIRDVGSSAGLVSVLARPSPGQWKGMNTVSGRMPG